MCAELLENHVGEYVVAELFRPGIRKQTLRPKPPPLLRPRRWRRPSRTWRAVGAKRRPSTGSVSSAVTRS